MGNVFGAYSLLGEISRGGMAEVQFAVRGGRDDTILAMKRILPQYAADPNFRRFFSAETDVTLAMNHPNVVRALDAGEVKSIPYLVMEYIHGRALNRVLASLVSAAKRLPVPHAVYVAVQALEGLDYIHRARDKQGREMNVVLCDISPGNIMLGYDGSVKLIDFGIATSRVKFFEQIGFLKGKKNYMAPEQLRGLPIDARADIFAMAVCTLELISAKVMFANRSEFEVEEAVRTGRIPALGELVKDPPPGLEAVIQKALSLNREDRYPTAAAFADALRPYARLGRGAPVGPADLANVLKLFVPDLIRTDDVKLELVRNRSRVSEPGSDGAPVLDSEPPTTPRSDIDSKLGNS